MRIIDLFEALILAERGDSNPSNALKTHKLLTHIPNINDKTNGNNSIV